MQDIECSESSQTRRPSYEDLIFIQLRGCHLSQLLHLYATCEILKHYYLFVLKQGLGHPYPVSSHYLHSFQKAKSKKLKAIILEYV